MTTDKKLIIVKMDNRPPELMEREGDWEHWVAAGLGVERELVGIVNVLDGETLPPPEQLLGVVLPGSTAMVTDKLAWSERVAVWLPDVVNAGVPVLGICYGHQLLSYAMGGRVGRNPNGRQLGATTIEMYPEAKSDPLFVDSPERFPVLVSHSQSVLELPPGAVVLGRSANDPHYAIRIGSCAWGLQFHPEFTVPELYRIIHDRADAIVAEGLDPERLRRSVVTTPESNMLIRGFGRIAIQKAGCR